MPELPEVETLRRQLQQVVVGKKIAKVEVLRSKSFQGKVESLIGQKIAAVERQAKILLLRFNQGFPVGLIHLKMTGQLIYQPLSINHQSSRIVGGHPTLDWVSQLPSKHTRVIIEFSDGSKLFFNDLRVFGWLRVVEKEADLERELSSFRGIEPLTADFTVDNLMSLFKRTARPIKLVLMDQSSVAGVGNIYANDALWDAKIYPRRSAKTLSRAEVERLKESVEKVLRFGIKYGGASENTYRQLSGIGGKYQEHFLVYGKERQPCGRCGTQIQKLGMGGRGTFFCPRCQKMS